MQDSKKWGETENRWEKKYELDKKEKKNKN